MNLEPAAIVLVYPLYSLIAGIILQIWPKRLWLGPLLAGLFHLYLLYITQDSDYVMYVVFNVLVSFCGALLVYAIQRLLSRRKKKRRG
ncbi:hypothetical protein [Marininema halotolerans]|uniref:Uncharacterized protein n=1 Tax=Marininema halotolerans TaxID=1155944 RepID=A0A1I6TUP3_9BACL|nr:hypothetical protein [Marininema halotolerans]SFS92895.1 hypothetical protein SAMN05444972_11187 [Marininema halotolerans]